ncbi:hypothetical protein Ptr902_02138 [Pyrenophora tritici-repentis]|nr:hypothetical protein Ptr902_02138 [Pyrenophora tritici-repentis]
MSHHQNEAPIDKRVLQHHQSEIPTNQHATLHHHPLIEVNHAKFIRVLVWRCSHSDCAHDNLSLMKDKDCNCGWYEALVGGELDGSGIECMCECDGLVTIWKEDLCVLCWRPAGLRCLVVDIKLFGEVRIIERERGDESDEDKDQEEEREEKERKDEQKRKEDVDESEEKQRKKRKGDRELEGPITKIPRMEEDEGIAHSRQRNEDIDLWIWNQDYQIWYRARSRA